MVPASTNATRRARASAAAGCLISLTLGVSIGAAPARAAPPAPVNERLPTIAVSYGDLDLATERGAQTLLHRIRDAAQQVCPLADIRNLEAFSASRRCERQAITRAVARVGSPRLAALYSLRARRG